MCAYISTYHDVLIRCFFVRCCPWDTSPSCFETQGGTTRSAQSKNRQRRPHAIEHGATSTSQNPACHGGLGPACPPPKSHARRLSESRAVSGVFISLWTRQTDKTCQKLISASSSFIRIFRPTFSGLSSDDNWMIVEKDADWLLTRLLLQLRKVTLACLPCKASVLSLVAALLTGQHRSMVGVV